MILFTLHFDIKVGYQWTSKLDNIYFFCKLSIPWVIKQNDDIQFQENRFISFKWWNIYCFFFKNVITHSWTMFLVILYELLLPNFLSFNVLFDMCRHSYIWKVWCLVTLPGIDMLPLSFYSHLKLTRYDWVIHRIKKVKLKRTLSTRFMPLNIKV